MALYVFVGVGGVIPAMHNFAIRDPHYIPWTRVHLWAIGGAFYVGGAVIYATKIPERWWPGRFDTFVSPHQLTFRERATTFGI